MKRHYKFLVWLFIILCGVGCKEKADINKLYNEAESEIELNFKYASIDAKDYGGISDKDYYHARYDKINGIFHVWSSRLADIQFDEMFVAKLNKFQCTDNQICLQNDEWRAIIQNAGNYYIVRICRFYPAMGMRSEWIDYVVLHNSDRALYRDYKNSNDNVETAISLTNDDTVSDAEIAEDDLDVGDEDYFDPNDYEKIVQEFLASNPNDSQTEAIFGYPDEGKILDLFPVKVQGIYSVNNFKIYFPKEQFDRKMKELKLDPILYMNDCYIVYRSQLYDCVNLTVDNDGIVWYDCVEHEIFQDI